MVAKAQREDERTLATFQAYQTVRIQILTQKKGRMPSFASLLSRDSAANTLDQHASPQKAAAFMEMLAARAGSKVQPIKRDRIVVGVHG